MIGKIKNKKITQIYYWTKEKSNPNIFRIQICYNNNFMEVKDGTWKDLKELEQQSGIKAQKA
jgi:hypothetical protein